MHKSLSIIAGLSALLLLSGCGSQDEIPQESGLIPFEIQTQGLYSTQSVAVVSKQATVEGASDIMITTQTAGRVSSLPTKIGSRVAPGNLLVQLSDTNNISNSVQNAQIALERAQLTEANTLSDIEIQRRKLEFDSRNVDASLSGSSSQLQLQKLESDLAKAELDFANKLTADDQQTINFINNVKNIHADLMIILAETLNETDKLLGITDVYENDLSFINLRPFLGAKKPELRNDAVDSFRDLKELERQLGLMERSDINPETINQFLDTYQDITLQMADHFVIMRQIFINSIDDVRYQGQINGFSNLFVGLQNRTSGLNASVTAQINASRTYFATYQNSQESLAQQIDSLRSQIELAKRQLRDAEFNTMIGVERSNVGFDTQITNAQLSSRGAQLQLEQTRFMQSKLRVVSPISALVADVLVDIGQDVGPGTPVMRLVSSDQQIHVMLTVDEKKNIILGQSVMIESSLGEAGGKIVSIASVADRSGLFKVTISLTESTIPTGLSVKIDIPVQEGLITLPLNALTIVDTNVAVAYFRDGASQDVVMKNLKIGSLYGDKVEILDTLSTDYELILTNMNNFDERTMEIRKQGKNGN